MTDTTVRDVRGTWGSHSDAEGIGKTLYLRWTNQCGQERRQSLDEEAVVAMTTWLAQPKPLTPEQIAAEIIESWLVREKLEHLRVRGVAANGVEIVGSTVANLEARIAAALRAAKEARDV